MRTSDPSPDPRQQSLLRLLQPLARLALVNGWTLPVLVETLKVALATAATGEAPSDSMSQLSVRTGVHRKDLRRIAGQPAPRTARSPASEVFSRWRTDARFLTARGRPRVLPRLDAGNGGPSFDALAASVTTDVHPRALLDELMRLGLAELDGRGRVRLVGTAYVPRQDRSQMLGLLAENVGDHLDAAVANLQGEGGRFLDQAMFSDGLSAASADAFNRATRRAWDAVGAELMPELRRLYDADRASGASGDHRVRLGVYGYAVRDTGGQGDGAAARPSAGSAGHAASKTSPGPSAVTPPGAAIPRPSPAVPPARRRRRAAGEPS